MARHSSVENHRFSGWPAPQSRAPRLPADDGAPWSGRLPLLRVLAALDEDFDRRRGEHPGDHRSPRPRRPRSLRPCAVPAARAAARVRRYTRTPHRPKKVARHS